MFTAEITSIGAMLQRNCRLRLKVGERWDASLRARRLCPAPSLRRARSAAPYLKVTVRLVRRNAMILGSHGLPLVHQSNVRSSHCGFFSAWSAISDQIALSEVCGCQLQIFPASEESSTSHGTSNGRVVLSEAMGVSPNRAAHQSLSCLSEALCFKPPLTLITRGASLRGAVICLASNGNKSRACRQSRTCRPLPSKPRYFNARWRL